MPRPVQLTPAEQVQISTRGWRDRRIGETPPVSSISRPSDYDNDYSRGEVEMMSSWRNYSYHKVNIPNGTTVENCNFSQVVPRTDAITGINLIFKRCNMVNIKLHSTWTLENCNTAQNWVVPNPEKPGKTKRQFVVSHPDDLPVNLIQPVDAVTRRDF